MKIRVALLWTCCSFCQGATFAPRRRAATRSGFDQSVGAFSPDGSLHQVEYAQKAIARGSLVVALQCDEGVVLIASGRQQSPLLKSHSVCNVVDVNSRLTCAMTGIQSDGRMLMKSGREFLANHKRVYDEESSVESVAQHLGTVYLRFNRHPEDEDEDKLSRPLGVGLLLAGMDSGDPVLYHLDPSGVHTRWISKAMGRNSDLLDAKLDKMDPASLDLKLATVQLIQAIKDVRALSPTSADEDCLSVTWVHQPQPHNRTQIKHLTQEEISQLSTC